MEVRLIMSVLGMIKNVGVFLGLGKLFPKVFSGTVLVGKGFDIWTRGFRYDDIDNNSIEIGEIRKIGIQEKFRNSHTMISGTTRMGRSVLLGYMAAQDIRNGNNVVVIDPKGDQALFTTLVKAAFDSGRENDLMLVNPIFPKYSAKIDPLAYSYMIEEKVHHIVSALDTKDKGDQYFINVAYETCLVIIQALDLLSRYGNYMSIINIAMVKKYASYEGLAKLREDLRAIRNLSPEKVDEVLNNLSHVLQSPADFFAKVSSSLRTVLTAMSTGSVGEIIGKANSNEFIQRLEKQKSVILIVQTGSMLTRQSAHMIARMSLSMIQSHIARRLAVGKKCKPGLSIYLDEAASIMYMGIQQLFSQSGQANVKLHVFTQSLADYAKEIGPEAARAIMDCTNTKIFFRENDEETCKYISDLAGTVTRLDHIISSSRAFTSRETDKQRIKPEDVGRLREREILLFTYEGMFMGRTMQCELPDQDEIIRYPSLEVVDVAKP
jgi:type IV secretory pathway TraG/TraD family ATPase VirD4